MRKLTLALGALGAVTAVAAMQACSDDVETNETPTGTTSSGVGGGSGGGTTTTTTTTTTTSTDPCADVSGTCEQACCKIENVCDFGVSVSCDMLNSVYPLLECDGGDPSADCNGQCVLDAECEDLLTLLSQDWDPALQSCLLGCNSGDCMACAAEEDNCQTEFTACVTDQTQVCPAFVNCLSGQGQGGGGGAGGAAPCEDPDCLAACQSQYSNDAVDDLVICTCANCASACPQCGSGGAGTGGAGGGA